MRQHAIRTTCAGAAETHDVFLPEPPNVRYPPVMRTPHLLAVLMLAGCGPAITQREILRRSKIEVSHRESWSDTAFIIVEKEPSDYRYSWEVRAGAFDYSDYPKYRGIHLIAGTERSLRFTRDGCLLEYADSSDRCAHRYYSTAAPPLETFPEFVK